MATRVGFIGLGDMGGAMASNLAPRGFDARVYDLDPKKIEGLAAAGAKAASSCRNVGEHAEVLSLCVPADAQVEAVLLGEDGALAGMAGGGHALELGRTCGIALPAAAVVSQDMARIYRVDDRARR